MKLKHGKTTEFVNAAKLELADPTDPAVLGVSEGGEAKQSGFTVAFQYCPVHQKLSESGQLTPFDNCTACIRNERDELRATLECVEEQVAIVYCEITGGAISRCNADARVVTAIAGDITHDCVIEAARKCLEFCQQVNAKPLGDFTDSVTGEFARGFTVAVWAIERRIREEFSINK